MSGSDTMRQVLVRAAQDHGVPMKALTVLDTKNDPFRIDTPANHRDGRWLATHVERLGIERAIHLRGLHYVLVTDAPAKPNGDAYRNTDADWSWLQEKAADAARWLGYISFDRIVDKRNAAPVVREFDPPDPRALIGTGVDVDVPDADDLEPRVFLSGYRGVQPYRLVAVGEKSSLDEVLGPICPTYGADLYLPTGEISDTLAHRMAATAAAEGRALVVLYFSDADPAGWQMPVSLGRRG